MKNTKTLRELEINYKAIFKKFISIHGLRKHEFELILKSWNFEFLLQNNSFSNLLIFLREGYKRIRDSESAHLPHHPLPHADVTGRWKRSLCWSVVPVTSISPPAWIRSDLILVWSCHSSPVLVKTCADVSVLLILSCLEGCRWPGGWVVWVRWGGPLCWFILWSCVHLCLCP